MKNNIKNMFLIILTVFMAMSLSSCSSSIAQIEKQAIVAAVGIDKGENAKYKVSTQIFQSMGAGSATPIDSTQSNTVIVSAEGETVGECMNKISLILGRKLNTGHNKYIVLGKDVLSIPLSESLDYFIRSEQTYLGVPVISSKTTARDIIDVELKNEVETAIAVENIIKNAIDNGQALDIDLLAVANSTTTALPVISAEVSSTSQNDSSGQSDEGQSQEQESSTAIEEPKLIFDGTQIVSGGNIVYSASAKETEGYCWLEGKLRSTELTLKYGDANIDITATKTCRRATIKMNSDGSFTMIYKIKARLKILNSFDIDTDCDTICADAEKKLCDICTQSFTKLSDTENADFLGIDRIAHSVYPRATLGKSGLLYGCAVQVYVDCSIDR